MWRSFRGKQLDDVFELGGPFDDVVELFEDVAPPVKVGAVVVVVVVVVGAE